MNAITTASTHPVSHVAFSPNGEIFAVAQPNHGATLHDRATGWQLRTFMIPRVAEFSGVAFLNNGTMLGVGSRRGLHLFDTATGDLRAWYHGWQLELPLLAVKDGKLVAAAPRYGVREIVLPAAPDPSRDGARGEPFGRLGPATVFALSPDAGRAVAVQGYRAAERPVLLEVESGGSFGGLAHPAEAAFTFSPDGSRLAACDGKAVSVYHPGGADPDEDSTPLVQRVKGKGRVAVAPKPRTVLRPVFRLEPTEEVHRPGHWRPPVAFTPAGRLLVRRPRTRVQLWDVATGTPTGEWSWRLEAVTCLAVAPDGLTAVAGGRFGRVVMWDLE